jgi:hypothetical protein
VSRPRLFGILLPAVLGTAVVLLFFGPLLLPDRVLAIRDVPMFFLPLRLVSSSLARDGLPWWNPMISGGQPIFSNPNYAAFYPPTWLALVLPAHYAMSLIVVLHAAWAFAGAWLLARRFGCRPASSAFAAVAFTASGAFVGAPNNFTCGLAWLPWVLYWGEQGLRGVDRPTRARGVLCAGASVAAQLLSGEPYSPFIGALALLCLALAGGAPWLRLAGRLAAMLAVTAMLAAAQLVPTLRHLADSPRSQGLSEEQTMTWSMRPDRLVEWVFPNLHGDPLQVERGLFFGQRQHDRGSGYLRSIYAGQLVLVLAVAALLRPGIPHRITWAALIVGGFALALGRHNPLYAELLVRVPPFSLLRYPEKFLLLSTSGLAFAAALGWERILVSRDSGDRGATKLASIVGILVLAAAGGFLVLPFVRPDVVQSLIEGGDPATSAQTQTDRLAYLGLEAVVTFVLALGSVAVLAFHGVRRLRGGLLAAIVIAFVLADLYRNGRSWVVTARAADVFAPPAVMATLPRPATRLWTDRLFFPESSAKPFDFDPASSIPLSFVAAREELFPFWANLWGAAYALNEDYDLTLTAPARHALDLLRHRTGLVEEGWTDRPLVYLGAWNIGNVARRRAPEALDEEFRHTGRRPDRVRILDNPFCLDRYRFVPRAEIHPSLEAASASAERHGFAVAEAEFLVGSSAVAGGTTTRRYADGRLSGVAENGGTVDLTYTASGAALLVAAITYDRGWSAEVDGASLAVLPTAIGQMALEVPAGTHRVALRYRDRSVLVGFLISLAAMIGALVLTRVHCRAPAGDRSP